MARNISLVWKLGVAIVSLLAAIAVYSFARIYPPEILAPFQSLHANLASHQNLFGSAPSFFYTLALGLVIGTCASSNSSARFHCLLWIGLCLLLELSQYLVLSTKLTIWLPNVLFESGWRLVGPYWTRGIFDPIDLVATLSGGLIALILLRRLPIEGRNSGA